MPTNYNFPKRLKHLEEKLAIHLKRNGPRQLSPFELSTQINFGSNDYLGLKDHPFLKSAAVDAVQKYGTGAGASRYVSGNHPLYHQIESKLAEHTGYESALLFNSCYQLNQSMFRILLSEETTVFADKWIHRSLIDGIQTSPAALVRYPHQDLEFLEKALQKSAAKDKWIVTESLFGMDGDITNLQEIIKLARKYDATLVVDDAHSFGIAGKDGMGFCSGVKGIDLVVGGFGKGGGVCGGYLLGPKFLKDTFIQLCPALIYTTALPPMILAAIDTAIRLIPTLTYERERLANLSNSIREMLGLPLNGMPIIPYKVGENEKVVEIQKILRDKGLFLAAIRSPTVPQGTARLRISINATHTDDQIEKLKIALKQLILKNEVQLRFGKACEAYACQALMQQKVANRLVELLPELPDGDVLEIGCGTGFLSQSLIPKFPDRKFELTDLSPNMCEAARTALEQAGVQLENVSFYPLDGEALQTDQRFALIVSNMTFQWFTDIPAAIIRLKRHLLPGGKLLFSSLDDSSFPEWKQECLRHDIPNTCNPLPVKSILEKKCSLKCHIEDVVEFYEKPLDFFRHLKNIGASTPVNGSSGALKKLVQKWQTPTTITYRVLYAVS